MGFKEVASLDAEVCIAIGKTDKQGKPYPKQAEGYYIGKRQVEGKRAVSNLHFLQTAKGNLGVWGTTDLDRKLLQIHPGTMVRITSTGTKPTPNGDMYTYKVEQDSSNTIDVQSLSDMASYEEPSYTDEGPDDEEEFDDAALAAQAERKARTEALLKRGKSATKN